MSEKLQFEASVLGTFQKRYDDIWYTKIIQFLRRNSLVESKGDEFIVDMEEMRY